MSLRETGGSFDIDLPHGQKGEALVKELLFGVKRVEVKRQDRAPQFGSLYIETEHDPGARGLYRPSGLSITDADYWAFVIGAFVVMAPTVWLREQGKTCRAVQQADGSCPTRGFRLPLARLMGAVP